MSKLVNVADGIYRDEQTKTLFHSVRLPGKRFPTKRKLQARTIAAARTELAALRTRAREAELGIGIDPYAKLLTVGQLASAWRERGCPTREGTPRHGEALKAEGARLDRLLPFWQHHDARRIIASEDCGDYHAARTKGGGGRFRLGRSVDAELTTLSNLLAWAARNPRKTGLTANPLADNKPKFDKPKLVRHCTAAMPLNDDDFHRLANYLLASDRTQPLGWQFLLEGLTGCRTSEILRCRMDASELANGEAEPGFIHPRYLYVDRRKDGIKPWAIFEIVPGHEPLRDCLRAFLHWHGVKFPRSPWFIPGRDPARPPQRCSLTHALHRACRALEIPLVISHGLRAYFVRACRSMGLPDAEIADRLGHRDTSQVQQTYGVVESGWRGSKQMDFLPTGMAAAWAGWLPADGKIVPLKPYQNLIATDAEISATIRKDAGKTHAESLDKQGECVKMRKNAVKRAVA